MVISKKDSIKQISHKLESKSKEIALMTYKNAKILCQEMKLEQIVYDCDLALQELEDIE